MKIRGRVWVLKDKDGKLISDIDTDMIFHNRYLAITDINEMGQYALDNLEGWEDFSRKAKKGDIIIAGENFGSGSSRQQAVDCFKALGIALIVAKSFGAIYKRNAINSALPIIEAKNIEEIDVVDGDEIEVDTETGLITNLKNGKKTYAKPFSSVQRDILEAGGLFEFAKKLEV
ncbi:3-isopropylmalate/(R)-2-methylmalate dehydratase small subunit [Thermotomaculum hydrothermale]|uniref:3-isopropylmalate/(R)-2-methylmalate dehydratase small subunit n=1 Tax=Thermotomaculum hydrothermale TaxID=981385 RepID=A0A7R6PT20_9BACT|nr:hypothetical protein [Thermotomaculum hydrothermale]BBB32097.1 3-isopropylmalate/(R)-2-methylmalate dehydratase small subunit [Thermotomaculum hydrothermale]